MDTSVSSLESVAELAAEEAAHARAVCCSLDIPRTVVNFPTEMPLMDAVVRPLADTH